MKRFAIRGAALAAVLSAATCFSPDYQSGIECSPGGECPGGFECASDGLCYPEGEGPPDASVGGDGGGPGTDGGGSDAASASFTVGGTVSDLVQPPLELELGDEALEVVEEGDFTFQTELPTGTEYNVSISAQPEGEETCVLANGRGIVGRQDVTDLRVECYLSVFQVDTDSDSQDASLGDEICQDANERCSLRAAVQQANATGQSSLILLPMGQFALEQPFTDEGGLPDAGSGDLDIDASVRIVGLNPAETVVSGGGLTRIFEVHSILTLERLTLVEAFAPGVDGGAIKVRPGGSVLLRRVRISENFSDVRGGGISNSGKITVLKSRITGNHAPNGGGIYSANEARIERSLFLSNTSGLGGSAVMNEGGTVIITNSTFSENQAGETQETPEGGALFLRGGLSSLAHLTITNNVTPSTAASGGGIFSDGNAEVELTGSIVAGNTAMQGPDCTGLILSGGNNLIGDGSGCEYQEGEGDQVGPGDAPIDPLLGELATIRSTRGHVPSEGSPALDAAGVMCPTHDQAGRPRPADGDGDGEPACDVGAIEAQ